MKKTLREMRPVCVVGIGLHRYQRMSETPYVALGLTAVREALKDANIEWRSVESAYTGTAMLGMAASRPMLRYLGATGIPMAQVENASASGSTAIRQACLDVASGIADVSIAIGVDKPAPMALASAKTNIHDLVGRRVVPFTHFALLANEYMNRYGATAEQVAAVAVKNNRNGANNPYAQRQKPVTLEEVLAGPPISGSLTRLQCCPIGEGAAAAIVASDDAIERLRIDRSRAVRVTASISRSERVYRGEQNFDAELTRETVAQAYEEAQISPEDLDVVELHDAFTIEELLYVEAMGLCGVGEGARMIASGDGDIGGKCAISASGGLLAMGHPIGPTGAGQVVEITRQLRGEAGIRQQPNARTGLAHMVGIGAVCVVHVLQKAA
ncbi:MAG TPA: thiolase family protein [Candidatus Binatus sp.]|uniref:thiolase family protein n=1 Tax=Candidatus Binatus sp. TaxID=2811406 RepID=UPI002F42B084